MEKTLNPSLEDQHPAPQKEEESLSITNETQRPDDYQREARVVDQIGERMKSYEKESSLRLDPTKPFIARIDGHSFSKFTRGFRKPFDGRFQQAMAKTTEDLVDEFQAMTGYTQSDEITLVFPELHDKQTPLFGGKTQKIASLMAGLATVRFNFHLIQAFEREEEDERVDQKGDAEDRDQASIESKKTPNQKKGPTPAEKARSMTAYFDARVFNLPNRKEALNNLLWRHAYDCRRNSVSMLAREHFSNKQTFKVGTTGLIKKLKEEKNIDWEDQPGPFKYGAFVKKERYLKEAEDFKTKERVMVTRSRLVTKTFPLTTFNEENLDLIFRKYWEKDESQETQATTVGSEV